MKPWTRTIIVTVSTLTVLALCVVLGFSCGRRNSTLADAAYLIHMQVAALSSIRDGRIDEAINTQELILIQNVNELLRYHNAYGITRSSRDNMDQALAKFRKYCFSYNDITLKWPLVAIPDEYVEHLSNSELKDLKKQNEARSKLNRRIRVFLHEEGSGSAH